MAFTKKDISSKILCVIDIGSYKLRICAGAFKNKSVEVLSYHEKRQDLSYFANNECLNLPGLCENISELITKLEKEIDFSIEDIVINYPFGEMYLGSKSINYKRKYPHKDINISELEEIIESVEKLCLKKITSEVDKLYGISDKDVQIILSRVNAIQIDSIHQKKVIGKQGRDMKIGLLNAFIPRSKHKLIMQIGNVLGKNIYRILPTEYCITKIFSQKDILIINIGATQTTISIKLAGELIGVSKIPIGINDLVIKISKSYGHTKAEIIENLHTDYYPAEKTSFLDIWGESIGITLGELLEEKICPKYVYIGGGGGNNAFIRNYIKEFSFQKHNIRHVKGIELVYEDMTEIIKPIKNLKLEDIQRIPLDMYVLLLETSWVISRNHDVISNSLQKAIKNLGYIKS